MMMKKFALFGCAAIGAITFSLSLFSPVAAQTSEENDVIKILQQNAVAFAKNDMAAMNKIWATNESLTIFESGHANYGWIDYRDNHLGPEMKEMTNTKYEYLDPKVKVSGSMAFATMKYMISGDSNGKHFDSAGLATAVLEKSSGKWRIVHWHSSSPRRQPSPSPTPVKKS